VYLAWSDKRLSLSLALKKRLHEGGLVVNGTPMDALLEAERDSLELSLGSQI
jgi:hypothetical protein